MGGVSGCAKFSKLKLDSTIIIITERWRGGTVNVCYIDVYVLNRTLYLEEIKIFLKPGVPLGSTLGPLLYVDDRIADFRGI